MAKQIIARQQGDDYQARLFWLQACALLDGYSMVERVVHEDANLKSLDDVAVYYRQGFTDETGMPLNADFYQVKFHVTSAGALTANALCDPSFIGAKTFSLLQRFKDAHDLCSAKQIRHRLFMYTPWNVDPGDHLAEIHSLNDGRIRWDKLSTGGDRSKLGKVRKAWRDHLGFLRDEDLQCMLANVRIKHGPTLDDLGGQLNWRLKAIGLKPVPENSLIHPYDELTRKMLQNGLNELTAQKMIEICAREGLLVKTITRPPNTIAIGIRSFMRWAEDLQNQTQELLCLSHHFNERYIKIANDWNSEIRKKLENFTRRSFIRGISYQLHLDTHLSIAYLSGYLLPEKIGITIDVFQHSGRGTNIWNYSLEHDGSYPLFEITAERSCHSESTEIALAIGLVHDIRNDVLKYIHECLPSVGNIIFALPIEGPSSSSVRDGVHAEAYANQLVQYLRANNAGLNESNRLHIFISVPNGFTFCLGRKMQTPPFWTLYEHDFGSGTIGAYTPSIKNPQ